MNNETRIEIDPDLPVVRLIREFDAPAARVYEAHVDPDLFVQWVGPDMLTRTVVDRWDARTGGEWRYMSTDGSDEYWFRGCFHELRPDERIVQTFSYEGFADGVSLETLVLEDLDGGRCRLTATSLVDSIEARDAFVASGMEVGVREGYLKLDALLS